MPPTVRFQSMMGLSPELPVLSSSAMRSMATMDTAGLSLRLVSTGHAPKAES